MEGNLKADLRNARTLLGLLDPGEPRLRLQQLVHDVTVGHREHCPADVDVDALRNRVLVPRIDADTFDQLVRSLDHVFAWWAVLPASEPLLDDARWPAVTGPVLEIRITADERFRLTGLHGTRDALRLRFEKYLSKHPGVESLRLVDGLGDTVMLLVADHGAVRLAS